MSILEVSDIGIGFGGLTALDGVSFAVEPGEIFAVIGPNGAGKTTLFNIISGLYRPRRGRVLLAGKDVTGTAPHQLARLRSLAHLPEPADLLPHERRRERDGGPPPAREPQRAGAFLHAALGRRQNRRTRARAEELLAVVGLPDAADRAGRIAALRRAEAAGDRPRARHRAQAAAAR